MGPTILLVEDEPIIALREKALLKKSGYQITHALSGEEALDLVTLGEVFDLILMDIDLGEGMSGTEAARRILEQKQMPLAFLSSHTEPQVVQQAESITSYGYIVKHSGDTVLLASIKMALALAQSHRENKAKDDQVRESRDLLQTMFDSLSDGLVVMDQSFRIIQVNKWIENRYGNLSELIGAKCHHVFQHKSHQCSFCPIREELSQDTNWRGVVSVPLPEGTTGWYDISIKSLYGIDGTKTGFVEHIRDITQQKQFEEELEKRTQTHEVLMDVASFLMDNNQLEQEKTLRKTLAKVGAHLGAHRISMYSQDLTAPRGFLIREWNTTQPLGVEQSSESCFLELVLESLKSSNKTKHYRYYPEADFPQIAMQENLHIRGTRSFLLVPFPKDANQTIQGALIAEYAQEKLETTDFHVVMLQAFTQMIVSFLDRWQYQKNLEENERKTKLLADLTIEALIIHTDGFAILVNQSFCNLFGYQEKEILGRKIDFMIHPDDYPYVRQQMQKEKASPYEVRFFHKNKTIIWVEIEAQNFTLDGKTLRVAAIRDIRQRKDDQKRMRSLLTEKETLLREVHHRIKNNMATMMGILSLQADAMADQEAGNALLDARGRMQSMSVLYEKLYHGTNLESLSVQIYLESLLYEVLSLYNRQDITINLAIEDIILPVDVLSPLGILCNEIFTNSIKHGFQGSLQPGIEIRFFLQDQLGFLHIREQGVNQKSSLSSNSSEGFGMVLIQALTDQLNAKRILDKQKGWSYTFEIPLGAYVTNQSVSIVYDPQQYHPKRELIE